MMLNWKYPAFAKEVLSDKQQTLRQWVSQSVALVGRMLMLAVMPTVIPAMMLGGVVALPLQEVMAQYSKKDLANAYQYVNQVRKQAGMVPFKRQTLLEKASMNHATYLGYNNLMGHDESSRKKGYTGDQPGDRALYVKYMGPIGENVSMGTRNAWESVDGLMSAIYHRFGFLDVVFDEMGVGINYDRNKESRYVYKMGNKVLHTQCVKPNAKAKNTKKATSILTCDNGIKISGNYYTALKTNAQKKNPRVILWPPKNHRGFTPVFYEEDPDPLPDLSVSGNPISIHFNPAMVKKAKLKSFKLFLMTGKKTRKEVRDKMIMTEDNDPADKFTPLHFALFPLKRLEWASAYEVKAAFVVDGKPETLRWRFTTRRLKMPMYTIKAKGEVLPVMAGKEYAFYLPPDNKNPHIGPYEYNHPNGIKVAGDQLDLNTVRFKVQGKTCGEVQVTMGGDRGFVLKLAKGDNTGKRQSDAKLYAPCPKIAGTYEIKGKGEVLPVRSGVEYLIHFPNAKNLGGMRYEFPQGVKVKADFKDQQTIQARITGKSCQGATFKMNNGSTFELRVSKKDAPGKSSLKSAFPASCKP